MDWSRRLLLASIPSIALGGCISNVQRTSNDPNTTENMSKKGQDQTLTVNRVIKNEEITYIENNNSVKYRSGTESIHEENNSEPTTKPEYSVIPFSQWARTRCATIAVEALNEELDQTFEKSLTGISGAINHSDGKKEVYIDYSVTRNQDGEVIEEPKVSFENIVSATPKQVVVTITLAGQKHEETYDIYVRESTKVQQ